MQVLNQEMDSKTYDSLLMYDQKIRQIETREQKEQQMVLLVKTGIKSTVITSLTRFAKICTKHYQNDWIVGDKNQL